MSKVSIIVPIFRVEKFIEHCARSLFEQTYQDVEYIFVNDCSPDNSVKILKSVLLSFPYRDVEIINHQQNQGLSAARNTGVRHAKGEYIMHVDSDDYLDSPDVVSKVMDEMICSNADIALFDMKYIFPNSVKYMSQKFTCDKNEYVQKLIQRDFPLCVWGAVYKRSLYVDNNIWAVDGLNFAEDYAVKPRLAFMANKIIHVPNIYYCYRQDNVNSYTKNYNEKTLIDIDKSLDVLIAFFSKQKAWSNLMQKSIDIASIKIKADKLLYWAASDCDKKGFYRIKHQKEICNKTSAELTIQQKCALWCANKNMPSLLRCVVKCGIFIKKMLR